MTAQRKKTYLILLGLGATGLLVDRLFLSSPVTGPAAAAGEERQRGARKASAAAEHADARGIPELPFPGDLQRFSPALPVPDLFAVPGDSRRGDLSVQTDNAREKAEAQAAAAEIAQMLQGVLVQGDVQYAIVNGRMLKRGENINGCTLTEISGTRVKFLCVDREVIATVPTSARPGPR